MARAELWWIPVGAGGHVTRHTSRWWELFQAHRDHRSPQPLFHTALEIFVDETRYLIEMTPAWGQPAGPRGVIITGPVGLRSLGKWRIFRYEVRCWPHGVLPDKTYAVESPVPLQLTRDQALGLLRRISSLPCHVWGKDSFGIGDMWNSNSLISWLLETTGIDASQIRPPVGGRAPGWAAGVFAARTAA